MNTDHDHDSMQDNHYSNSFPPLPERTPPLVLLTSTRLLHPHASDPTPGSLILNPQSGKILHVYPTRLTPSQLPPEAQKHIAHHHDVTPHVILPGLVDAHVHLNEPGPRTAWEGFATGTRAAVAGGVTTLIDMPLNSIPPTVSVAALEAKVAAARGQIVCDVGFYGGVVPSNVGKGELLKLVARGVRGFKGFLVDSGVPEFPAISSTEIQLAMAELRAAAGRTTLMFHAEMIPPIADSIGDDVQTSIPPLAPTGPLHSYRTFLDSRPARMETAAVSQILSCAHLAPGLDLHIVHLSAMEVVPLLREARRKGVRVTSETCFHYLHLTSDEVGDGDARFKCCPPVRGRANQDALWDELLHRDQSVIQTIVSDHSPCTADLKMLPSHIPGAVAAAASKDTTKADVPAGDFFKAWGGVSSLGLGLSILNTERLKRQSFGFGDIVRWCAQNTAKQVGLQHRKGQLAAGMDADICVFDDGAEFVVSPASMHFQNKCSAYDERTLRGVVRETWLAGRRVYDVAEGGLLRTVAPTGKVLLDRASNGKPQ